MKTINHGKVNDCTLFAMLVNDNLIPMSDVDIKFVDADYCIRYDSGVYPCTTSVEQYICDQVAVNLAVSQAAIAMGKLGGSKKSEAKTTTARENGKKGGRPKNAKTTEKYEYYEITASKCIKGDTRNELTGPNNDAGYDEISFKVRGTSHSQHEWSSTHIDGLSKDAEVKIQNLRKDGYEVWTAIGDRAVSVNN